MFKSSRMTEKKVRLKISKKDDGHILCEAFEGIDHFGFGTFLCNLLPEEIDADKFSKEALLSATSKHGLNAMEIWEDNRIAWGSLAHKVIISVDGISGIKNSKSTWLNEIK